MNDKEFIKKFSTSLEIETNRYSCLILALHDARKIAARDINGNIPGNILENDQSMLNPYSFIGVINYLLILDLIGEVFCLKTFSTTSTNNIYKALKQFSNSKDNDISTIIALRNSLAHNYGLVNIPVDSKENASKRHKFILINSKTNDLIKYQTLWDGNYSDKSDDSSTQISIIKLQDLIETVYNNLVIGIEQDTVDLALKKGLDELKSRFTVRN